jgi:hypothetical protein
LQIAKFSRLKQQIAVTRQKAGLSFNEALVKLYWRIGSKIIEKFPDVDAALLVRLRGGWGEFG